MKINLSREQKYLLVVILIGLLYLAFQFYSFRGISWENYPYTHQDFWRRMQDAQYYLGQRMDPQFHPPLASLFFILFLFFGINQLYVINFFVHFAFGILIFFICKKFTGNLKASLITAILYYTNFSIIQQANYLGLYDLFTTFLIALSIFIFIFKKRKLHTFISGIFLGLAGLLQYSGIFPLPLMVLFILLERDKSKKDKLKEIVVLSLTVGIVTGSFFLYRFIVFNNPFYSQVEHFGFLGINGENFGFYLFAVIAFFKVPAIISALFGIPSLKHNSKAIKFILLTLPVALFFIILYKWEDWRFVSYLIPIFYLIICYGIIKISGFLKRYNLTILGLFALIFILIYNSLYSFGNFGIVLNSSSMFKGDVSYDTGFPVYTESVSNNTNSISYFLLNNNFESRAVEDPEINYFLNTTRYDDVLDIKNIIGNDSFEIFLNSEQFVRYHQFSLAFLKPPVNNDMNVNAYKYIIANYDIGEKIPRFTLIKTFGNLRLYQIKTS